MTGVAPSEAAARKQYAEHLVEAHSRVVEAEIPGEVVQVKPETDGEWITTTVDEARELHDAVHDE